MAGRARPKPVTPEQREELLERIRREIRSRQPIKSTLFPQQLAAANDPAPRRALCTTRRAGKTTCVLSDFVDHGTKNPGHQMAYIALTRPSAETIAFPILKEINERFGLNAQFNESKLRMTLGNGSRITLYGADRKGWSSRLLGTKLAKAAIDEAAFFSVDLYELIDEVLDPALSDLRGQITMMSTPGPFLNGMFYDICHGNLPGWSLHSWSALDNPHMEAAFRDRMDALIAADPGVVDTPSFRRMYKGEWVLDLDDLVYHYDDERNGVDEYDRKPNDRFVLGLDFGWHDYTAFSVMAWSDTRDHLVEVESYRRREMMVDEIASTVRMYQDLYPDLVVIGDPARKQAFEELRRRYGIPVMKAFKSSKTDWIDMINSDFATGKIKIVRDQNADHIDEMQRLTWNKRPDGGRLEFPGATNDACDAFLYGYRICSHYRGQVAEPEPEKGSRAYWEKQAGKMEKDLLEQMERRKTELF